MKMDKKIAVYVPSIDKNGNKIDVSMREYMITDILFVLSNLFGGSTEYSAKGHYLNKEKKMVSEDVTVIVSFTDTLDDFDKRMVRELAKEIKAELNQESVAIEFNGTMELII